MRVQSPCKDCSNRELGCHSTCKRYIQFQENTQAETKARRDFLKVHNEHVGFLTEQKRKRERAHR